LPWALEQKDIAELLDLGAGSEAERRASLRDLRRLNRWLGGTAASQKEVAGLIRRLGGKELSLLDLGTGSADLPQSLAAWAERRGVRLRAIGVDCKLEHLAVARTITSLRRPRVHLACADALHLPFHDGAVDIVHSSLFMHHFRPPALVALLREAARVSRRALLMNDLVRDPVLFALLRWPGRLVMRSPITRHDALASVRRAYTPAELQQIAQEAGLTGWRLRRRFPYRQCLVAVKE
jgi:ubiquinone/menaquinone biosynthesis C-methylase UbiE